jgi:type IV fimbrial biogenesis protein FimT
MNGSHQLGFTLWELLVTLLVAGILLGVGVPNVMEFQRNGAMTAVANDLVTAVLTGRTEAVKRQAPVTWCLSNNPTAVNPTCLPNPVTDAGLPPAPTPAVGFIVWVDENNNVDADGARILTDPTDGNLVVDAGELILLRSPPPGGTIRLSASCGHATFTPTGFTRPDGAGCNPAFMVRIVLLCDDRGRRMAAGSMSSARVVRIDRPGRAQVFPETANVNAFIGQLPGLGVNPTCP